MALSKYYVGNFNDLLETLSAPFSDTVVEAYIRRLLFHYKGQFQEENIQKIAAEAVEEIINVGDIVFDSENQKKKFDTCFERLFNKTAESYNFFTDQMTGNARNQLLDVLDRYYFWLCDVEAETESVSPQTVAQLVQIVEGLVDSLALLNRGKAPDEEVLTEILDELPTTDESLEELKTKISADSNDTRRNFRLVELEP
ncbi:MAG: hypothetical protein LBS97_06265 [Treponema sp.]|jgi:hypothetical protein|nr:hypothetical protein [Treponema sp.]